MSHFWQHHIEAIYSGYIYIMENGWYYEINVDHGHPPLPEH